MLRKRNKAQARSERDPGLVYLALAFALAAALAAVLPPPSQLLF
jgi:hypothetical protein